MSINLNANVNVNQQSLRKLKADLQKALSAIHTGTGAGVGGIKMRLDDKDFTRPLGRITGQVSEFRKSLDASNARVLAFAASAGVLYKVTQAFDFLLKSTINVEKQLTDINVILGASEKNLKRFGNELFNIAGKTGQSFSAVATAATEFSRQGLGMQETLKRTSDALVLARLSGMEAADAVNAITAAVNSFSSAAVTTTQVVNKLAAVDAAFAVSSADLAEGVKRSAAAAESAGVSMNELLAIITAIQEKTARGGAVIGNSLKTIFTRVQRPEVLAQLERLGVEVFNLEGKLRPGMEVLKSFAKTYEGLSQAQQSVTAELVGGVFQVNNLKAALGDLSSAYSKYDKALRTAESATDQAQKRNEALNDTLAARLNILSAMATQGASSLGEDTLKPVVNRAIDVGSFLFGSGGGGDANKLQKTGQVVGEAIFKGIGDVLSGPGLILAFAGIGKLLAGFAKFGAQAVKEFSMMGTKAGAIKEMEAQIASLLSQNTKHVQAIINGSRTRSQVEKEILQTMREQFLLQSEIRASSMMMAGPLQRASSGMKTKSHGHVPPNVALAEIQGAYAGGYTPGQVRSMNIPGVGKVAYNTRETVKTFPGFSQPAIIPPASSKAGIKYRKAFESVNGFKPMPSGGVPSMGFSQANQAQASSAHAAYLQRVLYPGRTFQPTGMAGIEAMVNMGAATSGIKVEGPSGAVSATKSVRRDVLRAYKNLVRDLDQNGIDLKKEATIRQQLAAKYKISDESLMELNRQYKEEAKIVEKNKLIREKTQAELTEQQVQAQNKRTQAQSKADFDAMLADQKAQNAKQLRNIGIAIAAPMIIQGTAMAIQSRMGEATTGQEAMDQKNIGTAATAAGQGLSGALMAGAMGFGPLGVTILGVASALPTLIELFGDLTDKSKVAAEQLKISVQELNKVTEETSLFEKAVADVEKMFTQGITGPEGEAILTNFAVASGILAKRGGYGGQSALMENVIQFAKTGDSSYLDQARETSSKLLSNATRKTDLDSLAKEMADSQKATGPKAFDDLISMIFALNDEKGNNILRNIIESNVRRQEAGKPAITAADLLGTGGQYFLGEDVFNALSTGFGSSSGSRKDGTYSFRPGAIDPQMIKSLDERLELIVGGLSEVFKLAEGKSDTKTTYEQFKDNLKLFISEYNKTIREKARDLAELSLAVSTAGNIQGIRDQGSISRAGQLFGSRTVAGLKFSAEQNALQNQRDQAVANFMRSTGMDRMGAVTPTVNQVQSILMGTGGVSPATLMGGKSDVLFGNNVENGTALQSDLTSFAEGVKNGGDAIKKNLDTISVELGNTFGTNLINLREQQISAQDKLINDLSSINAKEIEARQRNVEELKKIALQDKINFGGGISSLQGASGAARGFQFQLRRFSPEIDSQSRALSSLRNLRELKSYYGSGFTTQMLEGDMGNQLRSGLMDHHRSRLSGMGLQTSNSNLRAIADAQIQNALKPENAEAMLEQSKSTNQILQEIKDEGIKVSNIKDLSDAVQGKYVPPVVAGEGGGASPSSPPKPKGSVLQSDIVPLPEVQPSQTSGSFSGMADVFFRGRNPKTSAERTIDAIEDVGVALRTGFASGLKEAIMASDSFSDALRSMAINVLDRIADRLFSYAIDAAFNAAGQYISQRAANQGSSTSTNTASGAYGGYVTNNGIQRFAKGGMVRGGSGFRDDVPAMLSQGEFVIRKSAVNKYGEGFLNSLNMNTGGAVISAPNTLIANDAKRPTDFKYNISNRLSAFAVTNEDATDVRNRRSLADKIIQNRVQYIQAKQAYKAEQRARLIQAYIGAATIMATYGIGQAMGGGGGGGGAGGDGGVDPAGEIGVSTGGFIRKYASGGYVDDVPAMLMGGEMVMNRDSVNRYGRGFFEKLNRGQLNMAEGGLVGGDMSFGGGGSSTSVIDVFDRLIESNEALRDSIEGTQSQGGTSSGLNKVANAGSSATNNVTVNINIDKSGGSSSDAQSSSSGGNSEKEEEERARSMSESIRSACLDVIINEKRPGGALADLKGPRS